MNKEERDAAITVLEEELEDCEFQSRLNENPDFVKKKLFDMQIIRTCLEALKEEPRPKGKWLTKKYVGVIGGAPMYMCQCSNCKDVLLNGSWYSYCPHCGARIEE